MDETRDTELGRSLDALGEPDHGPEYWREVRLRVAEAAAEGGRPSIRRRLRAAFARRPLRLALAAAAVAAVTAVALLAGLPRTSGPQGVSAAEVIDRALAAYSSGRTWQADLTVKYYASDMWDLPRWDVAHLDVVRDAAGQLPRDLVRRDGRRPARGPPSRSTTRRPAAWCGSGERAGSGVSSLATRSGRRTRRRSEWTGARRCARWRPRGN